ncbi:hypothetical protein EJ05DRAFT_485200 [Pseudovirgaria hyperparasitica]|uniref:Uncharacterized protein n=1 Tax=Pseudovirgaria hyperparasitica TaxID=470096 RepID=A0A6A6W8F6_9PEZI|nr:uncharacterized protein EJ05DRAFT_485200 [Pseudovirgaria hyperparasitica]KAF2759132.1 hypothetical protein EJ05DRAFT_485200 [Pseudovirgaria hyperparasitica]
MPSRISVSVLIAALASSVAAQDPFYMCTENTCEQCPSAVASAGTGYPECVVYNSEDVFANQGYQGTEGGGYSVFFDVQAHEPGCATIIKTPAGTDLAGCGVAIGAFKQPACVALAMESSFMVQTCCGTDCDSAGAKMIRGLGGARSVTVGARGGVYLKHANGTIIEPAEVGPPPELQGAKHQTRSILSKRDCTKNSWQGGEVLTKPADNVQIVYDQEVQGGSGGTSVAITKERTQQWSTSMSLGIADILSLGVSTEFTESESTSKQVMFSVPAGQSGKVGWTATMNCSTGKGQCDDGEVEGEVCWPIKNGDDIVGTYRVIASS